MGAASPEGHTIGYLVTFNTATTITGVERDNSSYMPGTMVAHVWDGTTGLKLATGSTVNTLYVARDSGAPTSFRSDMSLAVVPDKQYIIGVYFAGGDYAFGDAFYGVTYPFTAANVTVMKSCSSQSNTDVSPACDTARGYGMRVVEQ